MREFRSVRLPRDMNVRVRRPVVKTLEEQH